MVKRDLKKSVLLLMFTGIFVFLGIFSLSNYIANGAEVIYDPITEMPEETLQVLMEHETHQTGETVNTPLIMAFSATETNGVGAYFPDLEVRIKLPDNYKDLLSFDTTFLNKNQNYNQYNPITKQVMTNQVTKFTVNESEKYISLKFINFAVQTTAGSNINYMVNFKLKNGNVFPQTLNFQTELYLDGNKVDNNIVPKTHYQSQLNSSLDKITDTTAYNYWGTQIKVSDSYTDPVTLTRSGSPIMRLSDRVTNTTSSAERLGAVYIEKYQTTFDVDIPEGMDYEMASRNIYVGDYNNTQVGIGVKNNPKWKIEIVENTERKIKVVATYDASGTVTPFVQNAYSYLYLYLDGKYTFTFKKPIQPKLVTKANTTYQNFSSDEVFTIPERSITNEFYRASYYTEEQQEAFNASGFEKKANVEEAKDGELITYTFNDIKDLGSPYMQDLYIIEDLYDKDYLEVVFVDAGEYDRPDDIQVSFGPLARNYSSTDKMYLYSTSGTQKLLTNNEIYNVETNNPTWKKAVVGFKISNKAGKTGEVKVLRPPSITFRVNPSYKYDYGYTIKNTAQLQYIYYFGGLSNKRYPIVKDSTANVKYIAKNEEDEDRELGKIQYSKSVANTTRNTGEYLPGDTVRYTLTFYNLSKASNMDDFVIVDTPNEYVDLSTMTNPTFTASSGSSLSMNGDYKDDSSPLANISRMVTKGDGKKELQMAFKDSKGLLAAPESSTSGGYGQITYTVKIRKDVSFVNVANSFVIKRLDQDNKLIDYGHTGATSSFFVSGYPPKVGIQSTVDKPNPQASDEITVNSTVQNFEYTYPDGTTPGPAEELILSYASGDLRNGATSGSSRWPNSQYSYTYTEGTFEILGIANEDGELLDNRDISGVTATHQQQYDVNTTGSNYGPYYYMAYNQFKLKNIKLNPGEQLLVQFKVKPDPTMFVGTSENYKPYYTTTLNSKVFVGATYKDGNGITKEYRYKEAVSIDPSLNFGVLANTPSSSYGYDGIYAYNKNYINHALPIKVMNENPKLRVDTNISYGKRSGSTYNIASSVDGNNTINYNKGEDFITIFTISSPADGNETQSLGTVVFEIDPRQTVDISQGLIPNSANGYGYDWSQFPIESLGDNQYRVDLSSVTLAKGQSFKFFLPSKVKADFDSDWTESQVKIQFENKFSLFLKDSAGYYKTPAEVNANTAERRFIAVDEDLTIGGLDGNLDTTYRLETSGYANYIREVYYPGIMNYSDTVAGTPSIQPSDSITMRTFITNKNLSTTAAESFGKNPYVIIDIPTGMGLANKTITLGYRGYFYSSSYTVNDSQIKVLPDGRTRVAIKFTNFNQADIPPTGPFATDNYTPYIQYQLSSNVSTGYGTKVLETYVVPEQDFRAENITLKGDTTGDITKKAYSQGDYYTELDKEYQFSDFIAETGLVKAVKTKSNIVFSGVIGFNSGIKLESSQGQNPNSSASSGSNTLLNLYPGNVYDTSGTLTNSSTSDYKLKNISIIDTPAYENDKQVLLNQDRHTTWTPEFRGIKSVKMGEVGKNISTYTDIDPSNYTVSYTDAIVPTADEKNFNNKDWAGVEGGQSTWTTDLSSLDQMKAFRILFSDGFELPKGYNIIFTYESKVPETLIPGEVPTFLNVRPAYQSFAWKFNTTVAGGDIGFQPVEPEKVGINLVDPKDGKLTAEKTLFGLKGDTKDLGDQIFRVHLKQKSFETGTFEYVKTIDLTKDNDFIGELTDLEYGYYKVEEVYLVKDGVEYPIGGGYEHPEYTVEGVSTDAFTINALSKDKPVSISIKNKEKPLSLNVTKTGNKYDDYSTMEPKAGIVFELYYSGGDLIETKTTNAQGKVSFTELEYGTYDLIEWAPSNSKPTGFTNLNETKDVSGITYHKFKKTLTLPTMDSDKEKIIVDTDLSVVNELLYKVTESYVNEENESLKPEKTTYYAHEDALVPNTETVDNHQYVGYTINGGTVQTGTPSVDSIKKDYTIVYHYEINKYTIDEKYVNTQEESIKSDTSTQVNYGNDYSKAPPSIEGYTFKEWQKDGQLSSDTAATIENVTENHEVTFIYELNKYTVTYHENGATKGVVPVDENSPYDHGSTATVLGNTGDLDQVDKGFVKWNTKPDGSGTDYTLGNTFTITKDTDLYAQWKTREYTVTYHENGAASGDVPVDSDSPYDHGSTVTILGNTGNLDQVEKQFVGWNTEADGNGITYKAEDTFAITADTDLYAQWETRTYKVTYHENGGTKGTVPVDGNSPYNHSSTVTVLGNTGNLDQVDKEFVKWNTKSDGSGTDYAPGSTFTITKDTALYAQWKTKKYTVTYHENGGTNGIVPIDDESPYLHGSGVKVIGNTGNLTKSKSQFMGWNTSPTGNGKTYGPGEIFAITANTNLYAMWTPTGEISKYQVIYHGNGSDSGVVPLDEKSPYDKGAKVTVKGNSGGLGQYGYTFTGWNTKADGTGTGYSASDTFVINQDTTLYAQWQAKVHYRIYYDGNGNDSGAVPLDENHYFVGDVGTILGNSGQLEKSNHYFTGWNTKPDGTGTNYSSGAQIAIIENFGFNTFIEGGSITLYAQWKTGQATTEYSVIYQGNGNTGGAVPIDSNNPYNLNDTVTILGNVNELSKTHSDFVGWNTRPDGLGDAYSADDTFGITHDVTLYAQWSGQETHKVTYEGNGATIGTVPLDNTLYLSGESVTVLGNDGNLEQDAFVFTGWNTKADGSGTPYSPSDTFTITQDTVLYAQWQSAPYYKITYEGNGHTKGVAPVDGKQYYYEDIVTILEKGTLEKADYKFIGWNTEANGTGIWYKDENTLTITENITVYAQWEKIPGEKKEVIDPINPGNPTKTESISKNGILPQTGGYILIILSVILILIGIVLVLYRRIRLK